jgi:glutamate 5-kinase
MVSKSRSRWVVKAGSNLICSGGPLLLRGWMQQLAVLKRDYGVEVIWVTSGAIASAKERTRFGGKTPSLPEKQALSAIGQPLIMDLYNLSLHAVGLQGAQVLLTSDDILNSKRLKNLKNTLAQLLEWKVTPVLNENDTVATDEIKFGDNDSLSARVAIAMKADRLVILTDVEGLYEENPRKNPKARLISSAPKVTDRMLAKVEQGAGTLKGTGGMASKLAAARLANRKGIETWLVKGDLPSVLIDVAKGRAPGTRIGGKKRADQ